jgi:hypothetical protein
MQACRFLLIALGCLAGCNRPDEVQSAPPARTPSAAMSASPPARAPARCVVPTPERPPAPARAALRCPDDPHPGTALPRGQLTFLDAPGSPTVELELARSEPDRARGLMFRTSLPADAGMLFSWSDERPRSFWMRNTCIPLDMLFIAADGLIVGTLEQVPTLNDDSRSVPCPAAHVLELNAGWMRSHGVRAGQRVGLP